MYSWVSAHVLTVYSVLLMTDSLIILKSLSMYEQVRCGRLLYLLPPFSSHSLPILFQQGLSTRNICTNPITGMTILAGSSALHKIFPMFISPRVHYTCFNLAVSAAFYYIRRLKLLWHGVRGPLSSHEIIRITSLTCILVDHSLRHP